MKMKTKLRMLLTAAFFTCTLSLIQAQPGDPSGDPDPSVPIDGGLSLLIAAGVGYAAKHRYDKRKKEKANEETTDTEI